MQNSGDGTTGRGGRETRSGRITRRAALGCLAWAGTGVVWSMVGGVPRSLGLLGEARAAEAAGAFSFVQISDSHIGFHKDANPDVAGTLRRAVDHVNALPERPAFVIHTGDITHLSKPAEFDGAAEILRGLQVDRVHYVPGEHDALDRGLGGYLQRYGRDTRGNGWYSFDQGGAHFVGLINVVDFKPGSLPELGDRQLEWLEQDLAAVSASAPVVVFAHIPLWTVYAEWGWGTADAPRALGYLRRFGSVTVLNGHIHQVVQKVEGNIAFHTALSTAYPQPEPGSAPQPGPLKVPAERLGKVLGTRSVHVVPGAHRLATIDRPLDGLA